MLSEKEIKELHLCLAEMLAAVDRICTEHHITYVLFGGSLLGAVRHRGFIPWDIDADIAMPRRDYECFLEKATKELPEFLEIQSWKTDSACTSYLMRVRNTNTIVDVPGVNFKGSRHRGIYLDIFPLDDVKKPKGIMYHIRAVLVKKYIKSLVERSGPNYRENAILKQKIGNLMAGLLPRKKWILLREWLGQMDNGKDSGYFCNLGSHYDYRRQVFAKDKILLVTKVEFEGKNFCAPADWDYVLKKFYGSGYMKPPTEEEKHMEDHVCRRVVIGVGKEK